MPLDYEEHEALERLYMRYRARLFHDNAARRAIDRKYRELLQEDLVISSKEAEAELTAEYLECLPDEDAE